ncbi:MAG TPA: cytochrome c biogenesis protein CcdA [Smithellaceae bacterium]|nr:MAG: Thiol:disulfide interchange protein DsbD precursor [Deltaproteobacteria bacterium ADurb.BinA014]HOZ61288.1 cytochrome c biogenesis protein CcdA [Smithellaceae bacterium]
MIENLLNNFSSYLQGSLFLAFLAAYIGGVVISFTPCTYPLIPVTVGFIGARAASSKLQGFILSIFYVSGLAVTYSILGALAALSGKIFGQMQTTPLTYFLLANLCIIMGLAMLDVFKIALPVPQKIMKATGNFKKGFVGSFLLGAASGFVIGPCTAPVLAVILGYVALQTNILLGVGLLFVFSFGMGTLLIIVGTFTGLITSLPKSGNWMKKINYVFGFVLLGAGEYFLYIAGTLSY